MDQVRDLLVAELQELLDAENQLIKALPAMVEAAHHPKLQEAFEKHLKQTEGQASRLKLAFDLLGENLKPKPCKGMAGIIEGAKQRIEELAEEEDLAADLGLISAAQKAEHYEISAYGTARALAWQTRETDVARMLSHSLGEEESADFLLGEISKPLLQQAALVDSGSAKPVKAKTQKA